MVCVLFNMLRLERLRLRPTVEGRHVVRFLTALQRVSVTAQSPVFLSQKFHHCLSRMYVYLCVDAQARFRTALEGSRT